MWLTNGTFWSTLNTVSPCHVDTAVLKKGRLTCGVSVASRVRQPQPDWRSGKANLRLTPSAYFLHTLLLSCRLELCCVASSRRAKRKRQILRPDWCSIFWIISSVCGDPRCRTQRTLSTSNRDTCRRVRVVYVKQFVSSAVVVVNISPNKLAHSVIDLEHIYYSDSGSSRSQTLPPSCVLVSTMHSH